MSHQASFEPSRPGRSRTAHPEPATHALHTRNRATPTDTLSSLTAADREHGGGHGQQQRPSLQGVGRATAE